MKEYRLEKIEKLKELLLKKEAAENVTLVTDDTDSRPEPEPTVEAEPINLLESESHILGQPFTEPRPKSLEGISPLDLELLAIDGNLSPTEQAWYRKKNPTHESPVHPKFQWLL